jgi:hypothetical protein
VAKRLLLKKHPTQQCLKSDNMSEMKLIMENWRQSVLFEDLDDIKNDAGKIKDIIKLASEDKDKESIEKKIAALMKDEDVAKALEAINEFEKEVESQEQQNEGVGEWSAEKGRELYVAVDQWASSDSGKDIMKTSTKVLALALVAKGLLAAWKGDSRQGIDSLQAASDLLKAGGEDVLQVLSGASDLALGESHKT